MEKILTEYIDSHPYTGERNIKGYLKLSTKKYFDHFFDGSLNYQQVENITRGKIYEVISVIGYGDGEDVVILDDNGNEQRLADWFFEELTEEDIKSLEQTCSSEIDKNRTKILKMK